MRSTRGLSRGLRTRAGSTAKPRAWAYSRKASLSRGRSRRRRSTMAFMLSGITTENTPPKNSHAASNPAITSAKRLAVGRPDEHVPRVHRGEDQPVHHPPTAITRRR